VGLDTKDDAAVYRLDASKAIVVTTDFFSPVVDDPFDFGRVAAANALSDVYAMGGRPLVALNIVAFPSADLPLRILQRILAGGAQVATEAGCALVGGHSIEDPEPKYGLAVVGLVPPHRVFRNVGARPGDRLLLTKPIGTGVITTAIKRRRARPKEIRVATELMATLNRTASEVLVRHARSVHAVTDVTGYGLVGHLLEMLEGSKAAARLDAAAIPILPAARRLAAEGIFPGGTRANLSSAGKRLIFHGSVAADETFALLLADAQTSGGLLVAVAPRSAARITAALAAEGVQAHTIGRITAGRPRIVVDGTASR
jgi:selenide, water dikinase